MAYNLSYIRKVEDCDLLIELIEKDKKTIGYREFDLERKQEDVSSSAPDIEMEIASAISEINYLDGVNATMPPGKTLNANLKKKKRLEVKLYLLQDRKVTNGLIAMAIKEYELGKTDAETTQADEFLTALNGRRTELSAQSPGGAV